MAIISFTNYKRGQTTGCMGAVMRYTMQNKKTECDGQQLVTGINCQLESVYSDFMTTKRLTPPPEDHPTKAEWEDLQSALYTLGYHTERQIGYLKKVSGLLAQLPTRTQMDELLKAVKHLEQMSEQAGKRNEKRFSLPSIRLPRLSLPDIPWTSLLLGLAALALTGLVLWVVWSSLDTLWSAARGLLP